MKIRKIKLGEFCYFESLKRNFVKQIIKLLYNNKIVNMKSFEFDYEEFETRIIFLNEIMEQQNWNNVLESAYSMFNDSYGAPYYRIYETKEGIVWLVVSEEPFENTFSDFFVSKQEIKRIRGK